MRCHKHHPQLISVPSCKLPPDQIWCCPLGFALPGSNAPATSPADAAQTSQAHQPLNLFELDDRAHIDELATDSVSAIRAVTHLVDQANALSHDLIVAELFAGRATTSILESTAGDLQVFAHGLGG